LEMKSLLQRGSGGRSVLGKLSAGLALAFLLGQAPAGAAVVVDFTKVTNNNTEDLSAQLSLTIYGAADANPYQATTGVLSATQVLMVLSNNVGIASNIAEFYVDNGPILTGPTVFNSLGGFTAFTGGAVNPGNLPGGNTLTPAFVADVLFSADVDPGNPDNGVNEAIDRVGFLYTTTNPLADIIAGLADGSLRFGLHVRSIGEEGGSDSYVNGGGGPPITEVPEPTSVFLAGLALLGLAASRKLRQA
jgi:hypothetical protein